MFPLDHNLNQLRKIVGYLKYILEELYIIDLLLINDNHDINSYMSI
jgi:hypothetical protein